MPNIPLTHCMKALSFCAGLLCFTQSASANAHQTPDEIQLSAEKVPVDIWQKNRFDVSLTDGLVALRDIGSGPFNDASFWEVDFNAALPFGPKEFLVDVVVGDGHTTLWGDQLLQPLVNGKEAVPSLDENGVPTSELLIAEGDGKGFIPATSGTYSFQMDADAEMISSFAFMTAGAENYDVKLSNFRVRVWPEEDDRVLPQRPQVSTLSYRMDRPVIVFVDWHNDAASQDQAAVDLTLTGPNGAETVSVTLPTDEAAISGSRVSQIDLGVLPVGDYSLDVPAIGTRTSAATASFTVTEDNTTLVTARDEAWRAFYWITAGEFGPYPDAHPHDAAAQVFGAPEITADISGGWYDAGDYGKYSVNGAYAATMMLLTGLIAPDTLGHAIDPVANAPAEVADWLRVLDGQLGWLIKMQRADGGVYHKVTTQKWPAMSTTPEDDTATKWLMPVSSTATADFAGAMALAAAVYRDQADPAYQARAADFESAAKRALDWLDANPEHAMAQVTYDGDPYGGPYDDTDDTDERFFATAAYAAVTGDPTYMARAEAALADRIDALKEDDFALNWQDVDMLGVWALATSDQLSGDTKTAVFDTLETVAAYHADLQDRSVWNLSIADDGQLVWGSNSVFATAVWHWLVWAELSGETAYVENAETQMHYFFGLNPLGQTYITGDYPNAAAAPHFRPWSSGRIALPAGLIVGGPNSTNLGGDPLTGALTGQAPLRMYADDVDSYATNEVAINWQATWALSASLLTAAQAAQN